MKKPNKFKKYVGNDADETVRNLQKEFPDFEIYKVAEDAIVTADHSETRVRVWHKDNVVTSVNVG